VIIDAHCHIWERQLMTGDFGRSLDSAVRVLGLQNEESILNGSIERLIGEMDAAGIDKTVILPIDFEFLYSEENFSYRDYNNLAGDYLKRFPDRIIAFAGVDPRRGTSAVDELRRCVEEMGFRGLKLWTVTGFVPDDEAYYPLYEEAARLGITILVHTGAGPGTTYMRTCQPVFVDKLAVDFPKTNFIMAHMGMPWVEEAMAVAFKNPNVYMDVSAWQRMAAISPLEFPRVLSQAKLGLMGVQKILFGSDWPLFTEIYSQKAWVEVIRGMEYPAPLQMMGLPELTAEDKEMILGRNAERVLGLS